MLAKIALLITLAAFLSAASAHAQDWNSAAAGTWTQLTCTYENGSYIWAFTNLSGEGDGVPAYDVLAWTLQPFNIPEPESVQAPAGWVWADSGGWSMFKVADTNKKYSDGGPALEPGETLVFTYKPKAGAPVVNPGGPKGGGVSFTSHLAAVEGKQGSKWNPIETERGRTWFETVVVPDAPMNAAPEPSGFVLLAAGLASVWGAAAKMKKPRN